MKQLLLEAAADYKSLAKRLIWCSAIGCTSLGYELLNSYRGKVYQVPSFVDNLIPFNKYFIIPYVIWYFYVAFILFYFAVKDEKTFFKSLFGIVIGMITCFVVFYFYPTHVPRPTVNGEDIFSNLVRTIYSHDNPYNCLPSIHVLESVLLAIYVDRDENINLKWKIVSLIISILICLSTLYVKQHYFYDFVTGAILAYIIYFAFKYSRVVENILEKINAVKCKNQLE